MPTRTINLKLVLGKKPETEDLRRALWTTHAEVNHAVAAVERMLLLCRGLEYRTLDNDGEEVLVRESQVKTDALALARAAQKRNGKPGSGSEEEILNALRTLYEKMVPSCAIDEKGNPLKGDAQSSNAWVSPLMDPDSQGGLSVYEKVLDPLPKWITSKQAGVSGWESDADHWLDSDEAKRLSTAAGSPPGWVRKLRAGQPWQDAFIDDQQKKRAELQGGIAPVVKRLKELSLFPLMPPRLREQLESDGKGVSVWDRMAVRLAVAHLLSWESWNHSTKKSHDEAKAKVSALREEFRSLEAQFALLRTYEKARHAELKRVSEANDDREYTIGIRSIRAWQQVREHWQKEGADEKRRKTILAELQTRLRGKFGDPDLFLWIAADGRESLWSSYDALTPLATLNTASRLLAKRKAYSLMTLPDARLHPRWAMFEGPGGSNLRNYQLVEEEGSPKLRIPLLTATDDGELTEETFQIPLAPSGQLTDLAVTKEGKKARLTYRSGYQTFSGIAGGGDLILDRNYLENTERRDEFIASGAPGPVWFKLTLDVDSQAPKDWLDGMGRIATPPAIHHFKTALSNKSKHLDKLDTGLRVLSVDLGLRTFASCSVFELVQGKPQRGLFFPAADGRDLKDPKKLWAKHERSFKLALPGESPRAADLEARRAAMDELQSLKRDIGRLRQILRLGVLEDDGRRAELLGKLRESLVEPREGSALPPTFLDGLDDAPYRTTPELWDARCREYYDRAEPMVSARFSEWRRRTRPRSDSWQAWRERRSYHGGKSNWMVEYLDAVRKLILSWNLRGRAYGAINRQDKKAYGTVASRLLKHINKLKEDRTKTGADLLVQATRGFIQAKDGPGWVQNHGPCRLILFEDLARYRFRVDRPRRENSQLMKWNHREIVTEATMQAEIYGVVVETTAAGFSSRYLAANGAPGWRCRYLKSQDFDSGAPRPFVCAELSWMLAGQNGMDSAAAQRALAQRLRPGMLVPWAGGELFATLKPDGKGAHIIHADINAAQNLQRRFWGRCGEAFRISCRAVSHDGESGYELDRPPGLRLLGALQQLPHGDSAFYLKGTREHDTYIMCPTASRKKIKGMEDGSDSDEEMAEALAELDELNEEVSGRATLFRDPSGIFFDPAHWVTSKKYWGVVRQRIARALAENTAQQPGGAADDDIPY